MGGHQKEKLKCVCVATMSAGDSFTESGLLVKQLKEMFTGPESSHTQLLPNNQLVCVCVCDFIFAGSCILVMKCLYVLVFAPSLVYLGTELHLTCAFLCVCVCSGLFV